MIEYHQLTDGVWRTWTAMDDKVQVTVVCSDTKTCPTCQGRFKSKTTVEYLPVCPVCQSVVEVINVDGFQSVVCINQRCAYRIAAEEYAAEEYIAIRGGKKG